MAGGQTLTAAEREAIWIAETGVSPVGTPPVTPVMRTVERIVAARIAEFQYNAVEMARKADIAEAERDSALADNAQLAAERDDLDTAVGTLLGESVELTTEIAKLRAVAGAHLTLAEVERRVRALATAGDPVTHEAVRQTVLSIVREVAGSPYCSPERRREGWHCPAPCGECAPFAGSGVEGEA